MRGWLSRSLGFCINHVEESFDKTFALGGYPDDYTEFDTSALLRSAFKDRMDGLVRGVQGGVLAINEARNLEGYKEVEYGDEPRVQQQLVPLSAAGAIPAAPGPPSQPPAAPVAIEPEKIAASKDFADVERQIRRRLRSSHARQQLDGSTV